MSLGKTRANWLWTKALGLAMAAVIPLEAARADDTGSRAEEAWRVQQTFSGATSHWVHDLATDPAGNVYTIGNAEFPATKSDITVNKYDSSGAPLWEARYDGFSDLDFGAECAVAANGVVVTGPSRNANGDHDIVTIKVDESGQIQWVARYNGPADGIDVAVDIAVDGTGNVIVAGHSPGTISGRDATVVKYDAAGNELWTYRYDGPGKNEELVMAMQLDPAGNIHLVVTSDEPAGRAAIATLKINAAGQQVWAARYMPAETPWRIVANDIATDTDGNVIVTGTEDDEALTLKYAPDGTLVWLARYRAQEPAGMMGNYVRVDAGNNLVVSVSLYGSGINDAVLLKYNAAGEQLWATRITQPSAVYHIHGLELDAGGNAYATATAHNDALTVKVDANGNQLWRIFYHSSGEVYDSGQLLALDAAGGVIIAGRSVFFIQSFVSVVKYQQTAVADAPLATVLPALQVVEPGTDVSLTANATGPEPRQFQWRFKGRPISGATSSTLLLANIDPARQGDYSVEVSNAYGRSISVEARVAVLEDPSVTVQPAAQTAMAGTEGGFRASVAGTRPFTFQWRHDGVDVPGATGKVLRLSNLTAADAGEYSLAVSNPAGTVVSDPVSLTISETVKEDRAARYNGPRNGSEENPLLHVSASGEVLLASRSSGHGTGVDILTLKYSPTGELLWQSSFNRVNAEEDIPADLAVDGAGNVHVVGSSGGSYDRAFTTVKYDANGNQLWARYYRGGDGVDSFATSVAVDGAGNVTVAGRAEALTLVVRYDAEGNELWVGRGEASLYDARQAAVVDIAGHTYLGSVVTVADDDSDFLLRKFAPSGAVVWTQTFDAGFGDYFANLRLTSAGGVVVAGWSIVQEGHRRDAIVFKYNPEGTRLWSTHIDNLEGENDFTRDLAIGPADEILVVASLEDYDDDQLGTALMKIDRDGHHQWSVLEHDIEITDAARIAVDHAGNAYLTGRSVRQASLWDVATVKYDSGGTRQWLVHYAGPDILLETGTAVKVDSNGGVLVAGHGDAIIGHGSDLLLVRYVDVPRPEEFHLGLVREPDGSFRLETPPGNNFAVEASPDLINWTRVSDPGELTRLLQRSTALGSGTQQQFYRLIREN